MFLGEPLRHAWRTVLRSKRTLCLVAFADLLVCLPPALYVLRRVGAAASHRVDALDLARRFDPDFFADLRASGSGFDEDLTALVVASFAMFFVLRPFVLGAYTGLAATRRGSHLGHVAREGGSLYWKFLRLALLAGIVAYLLAIAARPLLAQVNDWALSRTEPTADRYKVVANAVVAGAFALASIVFDHARVGMRMARRPGVLKELGRSALFVLQHPASTLSLFLVSAALEVGAILGFGWLIQVADGGYFTTSAIVLVLVQLVVTVREAARLFHVAGAWRIRAVEWGEDGGGAEVVSPDDDLPDVLRSPLPWNVR
jgi:hypothetical protein